MGAAFPRAGDYNTAARKVIGNRYSRILQYPLQAAVFLSPTSMPADHSKSNPATRNRRPVRKDVEEDKLDTSHVREIELKRSRGEISCAECRRCDHRTSRGLISILTQPFPMPFQTQGIHNALTSFSKLFSFTLGSP